MTTGMIEVVSILKGNDTGLETSRNLRLESAHARWLRGPVLKTRRC